MYYSITYFLFLSLILLYVFLILLFALIILFSLFSYLMFSYHILFSYSHILFYFLSYSFIFFLLFFLLYMYWMNLIELIRRHCLDHAGIHWSWGKLEQWHRDEQPTYHQNDDYNPCILLLGKAIRKMQVCICDGIGRSSRDKNYSWMLKLLIYIEALWQNHI